MVKKRMKTLLSALMCAMLIVGTALTVSAAGNACAHDNYIVDSEWSEYTDGFGDFHWCFDWEERYCLDCGAYYDVKVDTYTDDHAYINNICVYCGHNEY